MINDFIEDVVGMKKEMKTYKYIFIYFIKQSKILQKV